MNTYYSQLTRQGQGRATCDLSKVILHTEDVLALVLGLGGVNNQDDGVGLTHDAHTLVRSDLATLVSPGVPTWWRFGLHCRLQSGERQIE